MFTLAFERRHNILLGRFSGVFSSQDISELDLVAIQFTATNGPAHGIIDFSSVNSVAVPMSKWLQRARQPALSPELKRFIVVGSADASEIFQMARVFTTGQGLAGSPEPQVVPSLDEALRLLGVADPVFEPVA
jgi:hypothetical protein